jgi:hypothetical protein
MVSSGNSKVDITRISPKSRVNARLKPSIRDKNNTPAENFLPLGLDFAFTGAAGFGAGMGAASAVEAVGRLTAAAQPWQNRAWGVSLLPQWVQKH